MISVEGLALRAGSRTLVENASFDIAAGEFIAVLGPNGAGKTTLLRTIAGLRAASAGTICIDGIDIRSLHAPDRARRIAQVTGDDLFADHLSVRDVVSMGRYPHHRWWEWREEPQDARAIAAALEAVGMSTFADRAFETLSSGERARIWIALALAQASPVLLLDEPTSHLDVRVAQEILALLARQARARTTVVCALHDLNEAAAFAGRILLLDGKGHVAFDTAERLFEQRALQVAYGVTMERVQTSRGWRIFPTGG